MADNRWYQFAAIITITLLMTGSIWAQNHVLVLDGSGDNIDLPESATMASPSNAITMEALIYLASYVDGNIIASGNQHDYSFAVRQDKKLYVHLYGLSSATLEFIGQQELHLNCWYHVAFSYDGSYGRFYINGALDRQISVSGSFGGSPQYERYSIGSTTYNGNYNFFWHGKLDEVRLWRIARSQSQIQASMCSELLPTDRNNLVGYWQFESGASDNSGNGNGGILLGNAHIIAENILICASPHADAGADAAYECGSIQGAGILLDGSGSTDPNNGPLQYTWAENTVILAGPSTLNVANVVLPVGVHIVTLTVTNAQNQTAFDEVVITVEDNTPPVIGTLPEIVAPTDAGVCYRSSANLTLPTPDVSDLCSSVITLTNDAPTQFSLGTTTVTWTATDINNNSATVGQLVTIIDNEPPQITVSVTPAILWPPNHKMVNIYATVSVTDNCSAQYVLSSITSNEPDNGLGDGDTENDIQSAAFGTMDNSFAVRAERSGTGTGRVYTVLYEATDASANVSAGSAVITVPRSAMKEAVVVAIPTEITLEQNYPNPFNPSTAIRYSIPEEDHVVLRVVNNLGITVATVVNEQRQAGMQQVIFNAEGLSSGTYLTQLIWRGHIVSRRMTLMR